MKCPRCSASLTHRAYEGVEIDHCDHCQGTWLDSLELSHILETEEIRFSDETVREVLRDSKAAIPSSEIASKELCPRCGNLMTALNYSYNSGVIIDVCPSGEGLWFDRHELEKIQAFHEHWNKKVEEDGAKIRHQLKVSTALAQDQADLKFKESISRFGIITRAGTWIAQKVGRN